MSSARFDILLVEDEPNDIFLIERAFRKCELQHALHAVNDGEQAIAYLGGAREYSDRRNFRFPRLFFWILSYLVDLDWKFWHGCAIALIV